MNTIKVPKTWAEGEAVKTLRARIVNGKVRPIETFDFSMSEGLDVTILFEEMEGIDRGDDHWIERFAETNLLENKTAEGFIKHVKGLRRNASIPNLGD